MAGGFANWRMHPLMEFPTTLSTPNRQPAYILPVVVLCSASARFALAKDSRPSPSSSPSLAAQEPDESSAAVRWAGLLIILLGMSLATSRLLSTGPLNSANDRSRWCTVWSLAEKGTYQIDAARLKVDPVSKQPWDTIDLVKHNDHFYSTKPPLLPWMVTQLYRVLRLATGWTLDTHLLTVTRILLFLINIVPMTITLLLWRGMIAEKTRNPLAQLFAIALLSGGTLLSPFLSVFNNHTMAATGLMIAIWAIDRIHREVHQKWDFALAGVAFGFCVCNELPSAAFVGLVFLLLWSQVPRAMWGLMVGAFCVPIVMFLWTNYDATGGLKPFYSYYGTEKYNFIHEGVPSYWVNPKGIDANRDGFWVYLLHCTIGHHGWFSLTPAFLWTLVVWGVPKIREAGDNTGRWAFLTGWVSVIVFAFYLLKTENYNYGGGSVALRWMQWLAPAWVLVMLPAIEVIGRNRFGRVALFATLAWSVVFAWCPSDGPWKQSSLFTFMDKAGWIDQYRDPKPKLPRPVYSWIYTLPDGMQADPDYWVEFATDSATQRLETLRISDGGPAGSAGMPLRRIEFSWNGGQVTETIFIHRSAFLAGQPVAECVMIGPETTRPAQEAIRLISGLPSSAQYWSSAIRYLHTAIQKDAIKCQQAYGYVQEKSPRGQPIRHYTRNVWFSQEIPFGVIQMQIEIRSLSSPDPHAVQKFWITKVGKMLKPGEGGSQ